LFVQGINLCFEKFNSPFEKHLRFIAAMDFSQFTPAQLAETPAGIPPPGQEPNFINPQSRSPGATAALGVMLGVTLIFLGLRLYSRIRLSKQLGMDD
jgi:hypothetical protein